MCKHALTNQTVEFTTRAESEPRIHNFVKTLPQVKSRRDITENRSNISIEIFRRRKLDHHCLRQCQLHTMWNALGTTILG